MENPIAFRPARHDDLPAVLALQAQLGPLPTGTIDLEHAQTVWDRMQTYPDFRVHLALWEGRIVGTWSQLTMDNLGHGGAPSAIVENVVVDVACRGLGIGKAMMRQAMALAREKGCYKLALTSGLRRADAHHFYDQLGFERHGISFLIDLEAPLA